MHSPESAQNKHPEQEPLAQQPEFTLEQPVFDHNASKPILAPDARRLVLDAYVQDDESLTSLRESNILIAKKGNGRHELYQAQGNILVSSFSDRTSKFLEQSLAHDETVDMTPELAQEVLAESLEEIIESEGERASGSLAYIFERTEIDSETKKPITKRFATIGAIGVGAAYIIRDGEKEKSIEHGIDAGPGKSNVATVELAPGDRIVAASLGLRTTALPMGARYTTETIMKNPYGRDVAELLSQFAPNETIVVAEIEDSSEHIEDEIPVGSIHTREDSTPKIATTKEELSSDLSGLRAAIKSEDSERVKGRKFEDADGKTHVIGGAHAVTHNMLERKHFLKRLFTKTRYPLYDIDGNKTIFKSKRRGIPSEMLSAHLLYIERRDSMLFAVRSGQEPGERLAMGNNQEILIVPLDHTGSDKPRYELLTYEWDEKRKKSEPTLISQRMINLEQAEDIILRKKKKENSDDE